jgi:nicotinamidase/pyrazinamidase
MNALLLVDVQLDFMPGGALAVADGDAIVPVAAALQRRFELVVATQDWHPADHGSFAINHPGTRPGDVVELGGLRQVLWPAHCVQGSPGAELHAGLDRAHLHEVVRKGQDPGIDSYSGFFDNGGRRATGLDALLRRRGVDELTVLGLATDYCVQFTVLDGCRLGYRVRVVADGCRAVELQPGDGARALDAMRAAGASVVDSAGLR